MVANVAYLLKVYIHHYCHGKIIIKKTQGSQPKFSKQKVWGKSKFTYMKHIKIQSCHMGVIFMPKHMTWKRQHCMHTHSQIIIHHTVNVYLRCCAKCPSINITDQETHDQYPNTIPSISFHVFNLIARCTKHGRLTLTDKKSCRKCQNDTDSGNSTKIHIRKELVMTETTISNFYTSFYIPDIQKLAFHFTHVHILGTNHCGDSRRTAFKGR